MDKVTECYIKLNGHFPTQLVNIYYKGVAINKHDFAAVKNKVVHNANG